MSATVLESAAKTLMPHSYRKVLQARKRISVDRYEQMLLASATADHNDSDVCNPELWDLDRPILYTGTRNHQRQYHVQGNSILRQS
jgi:hypothetical protein